YNLPRTSSVYQRFGGIDGSAYFIGGFGMTAPPAANNLVVAVRAGGGGRLRAHRRFLQFTPPPPRDPLSPPPPPPAPPRPAPARQAPIHADSSMVYCNPDGGWRCPRGRGTVAQVHLGHSEKTGFRKGSWPTDRVGYEAAQEAAFR